MKATLEIQNLKCGGCANTIVKRLSALASVDNVSVDNDHNMVLFDYEVDDAKTSAISLLSNLGYPVIGESNSFGKKAKSYVSCAIGRMNN